MQETKSHSLLFPAPRSPIYRELKPVSEFPFLSLPKFPSELLFEFVLNSLFLSIYRFFRLPSGDPSALSTVSKSFSISSPLLFFFLGSFGLSVG